MSVTTAHGNHVVRGFLQTRRDATAHAEIHRSVVARDHQRPVEIDISEEAKQLIGD